jgi:hypothetical protein
LAIAGVRLLIYGSGNAPAAGRGGIRDLVIVAEAGDLKQLRSRLSPTERLAVLLADTPADLLPTVCYLRQLLNACTSGKRR